MNNECSKVVFSNQAFNSILTETADKIRTETGGIWLGFVQDDVWYVIENIDPGPKSIFTPHYFEYDTSYVNHLAKVKGREYQYDLRLLGLWHRHPGSLDTFSLTDDGTNTKYAKILSKGAISALVNLDNNFRLTIYHVTLPLRYSKVSRYEIGDKKILKEFLQRKYEKSFDDAEKQNLDLRYTIGDTNIQTENNSSSQQHIERTSRRGNFISDFFEELRKKTGRFFKTLETETQEESARNKRIDNVNEEVPNDEICDIILHEEKSLDDLKGYGYTSKPDSENFSIAYEVHSESILSPKRARFEFIYKDNKPMFRYYEDERFKDYEYEKDIFLKAVKSIFEGDSFKISNNQ